MKVIYNYLEFLLHLTIIIIMAGAIVVLFTIFYFFGSFINWEWISIPPVNTWGATTEDLRIGIVSYFFTSLFIYNLDRN